MPVPKRRPRVEKKRASAVHERRVEGIVDACVVAVEKQSAIVVLRDGVRLPALVPQHINQVWLRAAVALAPLDATVVTSREGRAILWCVFPGDEHAAGAALDLELVGRRVKLRASESLEVRCSNGAVTIDQQGNVTVRGADVVSRASGQNRVRGAVIRFN
jgi:hypothetical protein